MHWKGTIVCTTFLSELKDTLNDGGVLLKAKLLAADSKYNVRRDVGKPDLDYHTFTKKTVAEMLELKEEILKPGCHEHIFCSNFQSFQWTRALRNWNALVLETMKDNSEMLSENEHMFGYEKNPWSMYVTMKILHTPHGSPWTMSKWQNMRCTSDV